MLAARVCKKNCTAHPQHVHEALLDQVLLGAGLYSKGLSMYLGELVVLHQDVPAVLVLLVHHAAELLCAGDNDLSDSGRRLRCHLFQSKESQEALQAMNVSCGASQLLCHTGASQPQGGNIVSRMVHIQAPTAALRREPAFLLTSLAAPPRLLKAAVGRALPQAAPAG